MVTKYCPIDYKKLDELEDLSSVDGDDFISALVTKYLSLLSGRLEGLRNLSNQGSFDLVKREVHSFKLSCQILGAQNLSHCLEDVVRAAQSSDQKCLQLALSKVSAAAQQVEEELTNFLDIRLHRKEKVS